MWFLQPHPARSNSNSEYKCRNVFAIHSSRGHLCHRYQLDTFLALLQPRSQKCPIILSCPFRSLYYELLYKSCFSWRWEKNMRAAVFAYPVVTVVLQSCFCLRLSSGQIKTFPLFEKRKNTNIWFGSVNKIIRLGSTKGTFSASAFTH